MNGFRWQGTLTHALWITLETRGFSQSGNGAALTSRMAFGFPVPGRQPRRLSMRAMTRRNASSNASSDLHATSIRFRKANRHPLTLAASDVAIASHQSEKPDEPWNSLTRCRRRLGRHVARPDPRAGG